MEEKEREQMLYRALALLELLRKCRIRIHNIEANNKAKAEAGVPQNKLSVLDRAEVFRKALPRINNLYNQTVLKTIV